MCPSPHFPDSSAGDDVLARAASLGRYMVLGLVGRGAMGEVYAAYDPELDRKVAIKLLRVRGVKGGAGEGRIRLLREAQAIAKLSHPNVVTVYDVGTFQDDVFIAMQFVEGNTVGYWLHAERRAWPDIVRVFADAGRGLAAAHEKDLIHRDFKPENVMISADGNVRVMDFGLARVAIDRDGNLASDPAVELLGAVVSESDFDPESTRAVSSTSTVSPKLSSSSEALKLQLTQTGAMLGTPAYMSPEQFQGLPIDARTDQFSFCVALYEALYGERPFSGSTMVELTANVLKGQVRTAPAGAKVPSWVRTILLRGLRREPVERWPSMTALLADLEKRRTGAPRRRFAAGAAAKLAGIWEAPVRGRPVQTPQKTEIHRAFLETGEKHAAGTFEKVSLILDNYAKAWSEMYADACEATHVRGEQSAEVLDLRMASLGEGLDGLRALSQVFRQANAEVVENAVSAAKALGGVERCGDVKLLRAMVRPPEDPTTRATVDRLRTVLAQIRVLCHVGRFTEGLKLIVPLEQEVRTTGYGPLLAETLFELGNLHIERRNATDASTAFEEAVWTAELSRHDEVAAKAAVQLVYAAGDAQLRFDAGEIWSRHADTILRRVGGHEYLWGWLFNNRGAMRYRQGRLTEAVEDARRAVSVKQKVHGTDSAEVGMSLSNLAVLLEQMGDVDTAVHHIRRAIKAVEAGLGPDHPRTAILLSNYAEILNRLGRFAEARDMAARALAIMEGASAPDGVVLSYPLTALALGYLGDGMADQALPFLERAVAIRDDKQNEASSLGEVHFGLARALRHAGRDLARAQSLARRARLEYASDSSSPTTKRILAQIDAWLAEERTERPEDRGRLDGGTLVRS